MQNIQKDYFLRQKKQQQNTVSTTFYGKVALLIFLGAPLPPPILHPPLFPALQHNSTFDVLKLKKKSHGLPYARTTLIGRIRKEHFAALIRILY